MGEAVYLAVTCAAIPLGGGLAAGWTANHTGDIARSWADGVAQLAAWRDTLRPLVAEVGPSAVAAVLWLLTVVLPAHGTHRAGVAR